MTTSKTMHGHLDQEAEPNWQTFRAALADLAAVRGGARQPFLQRLSPADLRALAEEFARPTQVSPRT